MSIVFYDLHCTKEEIVHIVLGLNLGTELGGVGGYRSSLRHLCLKIY